jgi:aldose 1-epimerase
MWKSLINIVRRKTTSSKSRRTTKASTMTSNIVTIPTGATLSKFFVPSKSGGDPTNIVLSFPHPSLFATHPHPHFGNTIGRTTNRIKGAVLTDLNGGKTYQLAQNERTNSLHGGEKGWGKHEWHGPEKVKRGTWDSGIKPISGDTSGDTSGERKGLLYTLVSPDGNEGFPGTVEAKVWYFEGQGPKGEVVLDVEYEAALKPKEGEDVSETVIGMTNHAYFNLSGGPPYNLSGHTAEITTPNYLVLDKSNPGIPTGEIEKHPEVPAEPNTTFTLTKGEEVRPIDDCFIVDPNVPSESIPIDTRSTPLRTNATIHSEKTGITLRVESTEPAFQLYTGKWCDVPAWKAGKGPDGVEYEGGEGYGSGAGVCVEPSRYVDAPSRKEWRSQALLKRGEVFGAKIRYWAWRD